MQAGGSPCIRKGDLFIVACCVCMCFGIVFQPSYLHNSKCGLEYFDRTQVQGASIVSVQAGQQTLQVRSQRRCRFSRKRSCEPDVDSSARMISSGG